MEKRIIYCWFGGGEMNELNRSCIDSWLRVMPDYEIMRVDESVFDVNLYAGCKKQYDRGQYAYVSDFARLWALANYGGIYLDTDVYALKPFNDFLSLNNFMGISPSGRPNIGVIGGKTYWKRIFDEYTNKGEGFIPLGMYMSKKLGKIGRISEIGTHLDCSLIPDNLFYAREFVPQSVPLTAYNVHLFNGASMPLSANEQLAAKNYFNEYIANAQN